MRSPCPPPPEESAIEHDRWSWFAGGVVLGLLIGGGAVGGYAMTRIAEARAETEEVRADLTEKLAEVSEHADLMRYNVREWMRTSNERLARAEKADAALKEVEIAFKTLKNAKKDR